ncbi:M28 family peptidase [Planctomycetales bacterium ZRK34]|nr:M28 family peptidase [Planctomycetales bacterium ZRK34]
MTRRRTLLAAACCGAVCLLVGACVSVIMPGKSFSGPLPAQTAQQAALADELRRDVVMLADTIGQRNIGAPDQYRRAADYIEGELTAAGHPVRRASYQVDGVRCDNLIAELPGQTRPEEIVILGAHYDSVQGTVGANDNASGVAGLLAIARQFKSKRPDRTLRFVAFANEEPPYFHTEQMGSLVYARACRQRGDNIVAMIALDGLGCYHDEPDTQQYPLPVSILYGSRGDFIGFVADLNSSNLLKRVIGTFRREAKFPSMGIGLPGNVQGAGWSDHWSFWQCGYPGVMVTDTLPFRYEHYHTTDDTSDKLDYDRMGRVVEGLEAVMLDLAAEATDGVDR